MKLAVVANKLVEVEFANTAEAEYKLEMFAPVADRLVVEALVIFALSAVKFVVLAVTAANNVEVEFVNIPFVAVRPPMNALVNVAPVDERFVVDAFVNVANPFIFNVPVAVTFPAKYASPFTASFAPGVVVPNPNLPVVLSKNNAELFCVNTPPTPINGTDPGVSDVYRFPAIEKFVDDPFVITILSEIFVIEVKISAEKFVACRFVVVAFPITSDPT